MFHCRRTCTENKDKQVGFILCVASRYNPGQAEFTRSNNVFLVAVKSTLITFSHKVIGFISSSVQRELQQSAKK